MHSNLDHLKRELLEALRGNDLAVFFGASQGFDEQPVTYWNSEREPDYHAFLGVAARLGVKLIVFSEREFRRSEIDDELDSLQDGDFTHEERRSLERRLRDLRVHEGRICALRLTFYYENRGYVFEARTEWFDDFLELSDEIASHLPDEEDEEEGSLGGYYSNN